MLFLQSMDFIIFRFILFRVLFYYDLLTLPLACSHFWFHSLLLLLSADTPFVVRLLVIGVTYR